MATPSRKLTSKQVTRSGFYLEVNIFVRLRGSRQSVRFGRLQAGSSQVQKEPPLTHGPKLNRAIRHPLRLDCLGAFRDGGQPAKPAFGAVITPLTASF